MIARSVKPCIVNVLHIPFQNTPLPGAFDLYFTFLVILPDAGAISTSAEFLSFEVFVMFNPVQGNFKGGGPKYPERRWYENHTVAS